MMLIFVVMVNILLVESYIIVRKAIKAMLENESDIKIIGEAGNSTELIELLQRDCIPDIILGDICVTEEEAADLANQILLMAPTSKLVVLSGINDEKQIMQAISLGAKGYLNKTIGVSELLFAIQHIQNGGWYICSCSSMTLLNKIKQLPEVLAVQVDSNVDFSVREVEIFSLMAQGYTNYEIAERLFTSKRTVENYRQQMLNKTGSRNTAALVKFGLQHGVIHY